MDEGAHQEMTLKQWVGRLPDCHRAVKEYKALLAQPAPEGTGGVAAYEEMLANVRRPAPPAARVEALDERFARLCRRVQETEHLADHTALASCEKCVALTDLYMALGVMDANYVRPTPLPRAEAEAMVVADYLYEADNWEYTWQPDDFKDTLADMDYDKRIVRVGRLKALPDQFAARVPIGEPDEEGDYEYSEWRYFATEAEARAALLRALTKEGT